MHSTRSYENTSPDVEVQPGVEYGDLRYTEYKLSHMPTDFWRMVIKEDQFMSLLESLMQTGQLNMRSLKDVKIC